MRFADRKLFFSSHAGFHRYGAEFCAMQLGGGWSAVAYLGGHAVERLPSDPDRWREGLTALLEQLSQGSQDAYKSSDSGRVERCVLELPPQVRRPVICKLGNVSPLLRRLGTAVRGPKQWREFWTGHRLCAAGVPTALPLACLWRRAGPLHLDGILVQDFIDGAVPLDRAIRKLQAKGAAGGCSSKVLNLLLERLAGVIQKLGEQALSHRDLKAGNIIVSELQNDPRVWLVDLDGVAGDTRAHGPRFQRSAVRLICSLEESAPLSRSQWLRLLKAFLEREATPPPSWKVTWKELQRQAQTRLRKHESRIV